MKKSLLWLACISLMMASCKKENELIEVKIPEGINHNELLRVKGKGVPSNRGRGDIILRIQVKMPTKLSRKSKEIIEELKKEGI